MFSPDVFAQPKVGITENPVDFDLLRLLGKDRTFVDLPEVVLSRMLKKAELLPAVLAMRLGISARNLQRYLRAQRSMPLSVLRAFLEVCDTDASELQGKMWMRIGKSGSPVSIGPSLVIDEEMVYIAELVRCDGHIPKNLQMVVFVNKELELVSRVRNFFKRYGLKSSNISLKNVNGIYFLLVYSRIFATILHLVFRIPPGKKGDMRIPKFILASTNLSAALVRASFDAEGNVQVRKGKEKRTPRRIVITNKSRSYLRGVMQAMSLFNIESRMYSELRPFGPIFRLAIYHQENLARFLKHIRPLHSRRRARLITLLSSYQKGRLPEGSLRPKVLRSITSGSNTRRLIAASLGLSLSRVGNQLYRLGKLGLVAKPKVVGSSRGRHGLYSLTGKGEDFLRAATCKSWSSLAVPRRNRPFSHHIALFRPYS